MTWGILLDTNYTLTLLENVIMYIKYNIQHKQNDKLHNIFISRSMCTLLNNQTTNKDDSHA